MNKRERSLMNNKIGGLKELADSFNVKNSAGS
jgi:hypothetical protein